MCLPSGGHRGPPLQHHAPLLPQDLTTLSARVKDVLLGRIAMGVPLQAGRSLVFAGILLIVVGVLVIASSRFSFLGLGRLPGDVIYKGKHGTFYFPIVTCLVVSGLLTLILWVVSILGKR